MHPACDTPALHNTLAQADRAHRQAARQRLGEAEDIGREVIVFAGEETPRAPETGLHLVDDEQRAAFPAEFRRAANIFLRGDVDAALALHQFEQHGGGALANNCFQRGKVVVARVVDAGQQGREGFAVMRLPGGGECAHRAPVKAAQRGHNLRAPRGEPGEF